MKTKMMKISMLLAGAGCVLAAVGGAAAIKYSAKAASEMKLVGAYVRVGETTQDSGLRFSYQMDKTYFDSIATSGTFRSGVTAGIIVCPTDMLPTGFDANNALSFVDDKVKNYEIPASKWAVDDTNTAKMESFAYIYQIPSEDYNRNFTAVGYLTDGTTTYTDAIERSVAEVTLSALNDSNSTLTNEQKTMLDGYLLDYTVTFKVDGAEYATQQVKYGNAVEQATLTAPEKAGYKFAGWKLGEANYDLTSAVKGDITLNAVFEEYVTVESVDKAVAANTQITLNNKTNGLGVTFHDDVESVTYTVKKTVGASTTAASAVTLTENKFTVEAGCLYDVEITATLASGTVKKYVQVYDNSLIVLGNNTSTEDFRAVSASLPIESVNNNGNIAFKMKATGTVATPILQLKGALLNSDIDSYAVYATLTHENYADRMYQIPAEGSVTAAANVTADGRYRIGITTGVTNDGYHEYKAGAVFKASENMAIYFDNIVFVPQVFSIKGAEIKATADKTINLNEKDLCYKLYNGLTEDDVTFEVTKTNGTGTEMDVAVDTTSKTLTVESGYLYDINITVTPKAGTAAYTINSAPIKKYIFLADSALKTYSFDGANQTLTVPNGGGKVIAEPTVDEFGNKAYKIYTTDTSASYTTCNFRINTPQDNSVTGYKVYGSCTVVGTQTGAGLSFNYSNWVTISGTARKNFATIYEEAGTMQAVNVYKKLNGNDTYVVIDNIVFVAP